MNLETYLLPILITLLVMTVLTPVTFYFLYRQLINFIKEEQKLESARIQKEFTDIVMNHFDEYIRTILPSDDQVKKNVADKIEKITTDIMQETQQKLQSTVDDQLKKIDTDVTKQIDQIQNSLQQAEVELSTQYKQAMKDQHQKRIDQFDSQVDELVKQAVGDVIKRDLNIGEHTEIIKTQLNQAREYYER